MQKVYTKIESIVGNVVTVRAKDVRLGDLALVGMPIKGRILATRSGHGSNTAFARRLMQEFLK